MTSFIGVMEIVDIVVNFAFDGWIVRRKVFRPKIFRDNSWNHNKAWLSFALIWRLHAGVDEHMKNVNQLWHEAMPIIS